MDASGRILGTPPRPVGALLRLQVGFEYRLKHKHGRSLRHPVPNAGDAQRPEAVGLLLRYQDLTNRFRPAGLFPKLPRQFPEPSPHTLRLDLRERLPADPGRAAVPANHGLGHVPNCSGLCCNAESDFQMEAEMAGDRHDMTDAEWAILEPALPTGRPGPVRKDDRRIMDGIFFVLRSGCPWRDLPERYGPCTTCYNRWNRWSKDGTWASIMSEIQELAGPGGDGLAARMLDSSAVRVHKHGAGQRRDGEPPETGRSRGGLTTKIHAAVDGAGRPLALRLSPGQAADCTKAQELLDRLAPGEAVIADKAYDAGAVLDFVAEAGGIAVIPSKANRKTPRELDREAYADRNRIERFFGKIKEFRRVATRHEKRARNYLSAVMLAVTRYLLRNLAGHLVESTA